MESLKKWTIWSLPYYRDVVSFQEQNFLIMERTPLPSQGLNKPPPTYLRVYPLYPRGFFRFHWTLRITHFQEVSGYKYEARCHPRISATHKQKNFYQALQWDKPSTCKMKTRHCIVIVVIYYFLCGVLLLSLETFVSTLIHFLIDFQVFEYF